MLSYRRLTQAAVRGLLVVSFGRCQRRENAMTGLPNPLSTPGARRAAGPCPEPWDFEDGDIVVDLTGRLGRVALEEGGLPIVVRADGSWSPLLRGVTYADQDDLAAQHEDVPVALDDLLAATPDRRTADRRPPPRPGGALRDPLLAILREIDVASRARTLSPEALLLRGDEVRELEGMGHLAVVSWAEGAVLVTKAGRALLDEA